MIKYIFLFLFNIVIGIVGYFWIKNNLHYDMFLNKFYSVNYTAIAISAIPQILLLLLYGKRVGILLNKTFSTSFAISSLGHGLNHICPFRLGELLKIVFAKRFYNIPIYEISLMSIVEKSFDLLCLSLLGLVLLGVSDNVFSFGLLTTMTFIALLIIVLFRNKVFINKILNILPMKKYFENFYNSIKHFELKGKLLVVLIYSILIWALTTLNFYYFFDGNLPNINFSIIDTMVLVVLSSLSLAVPVTIGNIGVFESVIVFYLTAKFNIATEEAIVLAVMFHLTLTIPQLIILVFYIISNESKKMLSLFSERRKDPQHSLVHHLKRD